MEGKSVSSDADSSGTGLPRGDDSGPWLGSTARRKALLECNFEAVLSGVVLIVTIVIWSNPGYRKGSMGLGVGLIAPSLVLLILTYIRFTLAHIQYDERSEAVARVAVSKAIDELPPKPDWVDLMKLNDIYINQFNDIARHQAKNAYRNSQIAMALVFLIIVVDCVAILVLKNSASKIVLSGIGAVALAFTGYITRTFLVVRKAAEEQHQRAANQSLIRSIYLWAERLAFLLPEDRRHQQIEKIIATQLQQALEYAGLTLVVTSHRRRRSLGRHPATEDALGEEILSQLPSNAGPALDPIRTLLSRYTWLASHGLPSELDVLSDGSAAESDEIANQNSDGDLD